MFQAVPSVRLALYSYGEMRDRADVLFEFLRETQELGARYRFERVIWRHPGGNFSRELRLDDKGWAEVRGVLGKGELGEIVLGQLILRLTPEGYLIERREPKWAYLTLDPSRVNVLFFNMDVDDIGNSDEKILLQETLLSLAEDMVVKVDAVYGTVDLDKLGVKGPPTSHTGRTKFEEQVGTGWHWEMETVLRERVRGVFWGNFLGPKHVEALGGLQRVLHETPCERVAELPGGRVFLQLTPSMFDFDSALHRKREKELAEFLRLIMPIKIDPPAPGFVEPISPRDSQRNPLVVRHIPTDDWERFNVYVRFSVEPDDTTKKSLQSLVDSWAQVLFWGGTKGALGDKEWERTADLTQVVFEEHLAYWTMDLLLKEAETYLQMLLKMLEGFSWEQAKIDEMIVGGILREEE